MIKCSCNGEIYRITKGLEYASISGVYEGHDECDDFEFSPNIDEDVVYHCGDCEREFTRDELKEMTNADN